MAPRKDQLMQDMQRGTSEATCTPPELLLCLSLPMAVEGAVV